MDYLVLHDIYLIIPAFGMFLFERNERPLSWMGTGTPITVSLASAAAAFCRILLGLLFVSSMLGKVSNFRAFVVTVHDYGLLPPSLIRPAAVLVSGLEAAVGTVLLLGFIPAISGALSVSLLLLFSIVVAFALRRGQRHDCGCLGALATTPLSWQVLARNLALIGLASIVIVGALVPTPPLRANEVILIGLMAVAALGVVFGLAQAVRLNDGFNRAPSGRISR